VKLSEWIQQTNKFLRQDSLKLPQEIIDELRDQQRFVLLDFDTQTLFTAQLGDPYHLQVVEETHSARPPPQKLFHGRPVLLDDVFQTSAAREGSKTFQKSQSGYDWNKEPNHRLNEAYTVRAALEEQNATLQRLEENKRDYPADYSNSDNHRHGSFLFGVRPLI